MYSASSLKDLHSFAWCFDCPRVSCFKHIDFGISESPGSKSRTVCRKESSSHACAAYNLLQSLTISYNLIQSHHVNRFDPGCTDAISGAGGARLGCKRPGVSSQPRAWCSPQRIAPRPMDFTSVFIKCSSWNDIAQWWTIYINLLYNVYYI